MQVVTQDEIQGDICDVIDGLIRFVMPREIS